MVARWGEMKRLETPNGTVGYVPLASRWRRFSALARESVKYFRNAVYCAFCIHSPRLSESQYFYLPSRREFVFYGDTLCVKCRTPLRLKYGLNKEEIAEIESRSWRVDDEGQKLRLGPK